MSVIPHLALRPSHHIYHSFGTAGSDGRDVGRGGALGARLRARCGADGSRRGRAAVGLAGDLDRGLDDEEGAEDGLRRLGALEPFTAADCCSLVLSVST